MNEPSVICLYCLRNRGREWVCPHCGTAADIVHWDYPMLRPGTVLQNKYLLGRVLGQGGFAITYLGLQIGLERRVAIKEYLPRELAERREHSGEVTPRRKAGTDVQACFDRGLQGFIEEGRLIVQCHQPAPHPNLVRVTDYFRANGTAYLVMDFVEGISLEDHLNRQPGRRINDKQAVQAIMPVLDGLRTVHRRGFFHRDVKPANIYLTSQGTSILIDFGSARFKVFGESSAANTPLTHGYAPPELYSSADLQGSWTDIYSAAATLYRCVTGAVPVGAMDRRQGVPLVPPSAVPGCRVSRGLESVILWGLEMERDKRPRTAEVFQKALVRPESARVRSLGRRKFMTASGGAWSIRRILQDAVFLLISATLLALVGYGIYTEYSGRVAFSLEAASRDAAEVRTALKQPLLEKFAPSEYKEADRLFATAERLREQEPSLAVRRYREAIEYYRLANEIVLRRQRGLEGQIEGFEPAKANATQQRDSANTIGARVYAQEEWDRAERIMADASVVELRVDWTPSESRPGAMAEAAALYAKAAAAYEAALKAARDNLAREIRERLREAEVYFDRGELTGWTQTNAYYMYRRILVIDPGNTSAEQGIQKIIDHYAASIETCWNSGLHDQARALLREAARIEGGDQSKLDRLKDRIN